MLIDTHSHLNFSAFDKDREEVIKNCLKDNVWMFNIGTNYETSKKAVEIAQKYERGVYAAIGLHPINIIQNSNLKIQNDKLKIKNKEDILEKDFDYENYRKLAGSKKIVAIGEIGLDYYYKPKTKKKLEIFKEKQRDVLYQQLKLAKELNLPIIFHCRFSHNDLLKVLKSIIHNPKSKIRGVVHCFTGTWEQTQRYLEMGFYLGFNGIIFKKIEGLNFEEIIKKTPLDKILVETDCPYLTPPISVNQCTHQRQSASTIRNNPLGVEFIAQKIAEIKRLRFEEIAEITIRNSHRLFGQLE